jgi:pSer/pThr/pTyr-binding forkhead associated (FHA) protein
MRDGLTRKLEVKAPTKSKPGFLTTHRVTLVIVNGPAAGQEFSVEQERVVIGRGPGVDLAFDDVSMSREHAALELAGEGYRVRDMASTNGVVVNGSRQLVADLKHGDTIVLGEHSFKLLVEAQSRGGGTWVLDED